MSTQQYALFLEGLEGSFTLKKTEIYKPGSGELLVKIKSAALNPLDWKLRKYDLGFGSFPVIAGFDISGDVEELGDSVQGFSKGDKVFFEGDLTIRGDGFQQYAIAPATRTAKIPSGWSYDQAATIPSALFTAWVGLYHKHPHGFGLSSPKVANDFTSKGKYANTPIVILGGASSVGQLAIQLARFSGFSPIITTASKKHEPFLKSLGVTHLIDRFIPLSSLNSEVAQITSQPIKFVYDAISLPETQQAGYDLIAEGGKIVLVLHSQIQEAESSSKSIILTSSLPTAPQNVELVKEAYSILTVFLETERFVPNRVEVLPGGLSGVVGGLERLESDQVSGVKLVVHPEETL
ncbi:GroES-like protein [Cyathus striatus]|nr:GroES-like protein [Cyathus striatus]